MNEKQNITSIIAKTISDAWFQVIYNVIDNGYRQDIQHGSFEKEQYRLQYPGLAIHIEYPWMDMIPEIPPHLGIPAPTTIEYVEEYFTEYLMNPELSKNETYRYSSRIHHRMPKGGTQLDRVIELLKRVPMTNQAVIEVGTPEDLDVCYGKDGKLDPACLRVIDFKVIPRKVVCKGKDMVCEKPICKDSLECISHVLSVSVYFRSWDLWSGLPTNLGGIELLKQYVCSMTGLKNGPMYAYSSGGHIYGFQEEIVRLRTFRTLRD